MKLSRKKFTLIFLASAFAFIMITNLILVPVNGDWFAGTNSPIAWKRTMAAVIYPIKVILVGPLSLVLNDPDPAPPIRVLGCAVYWSFIALLIHFVFSKIIPVKKQNIEINQPK
ncbi:hypothetical protein ACFS5N_18800 [Mucilaginibacter ximonensis]|uniref:DUF1648 domain-containing protein n=1 Tax=Mucilaginibacter ximonensis TaxID=538021 RepID=A0ABW5YGX3_9SPHI